MIFKTQIGPLREVLGKIVTVIDKKISRPILTFCMIEAKSENVVEIAATDLEVSAKIQIDAHVLNEGAFCINAKNLVDILREMPNEEATFEISNESNTLKLSCDEIKFTLLIFKTDDYPRISFLNDASKFQISSLRVQTMISKIYHAISSDETKSFMNGIFLQQIDNNFRAVASDGHRLALIEFPNFVTNNNHLLEGVIIPRKGVNELKKIADSYPNDDMEISVDDSFAYINVKSHYYLSIRLVARLYPKYQNVIPSKTAYQMSVDKNTFLTAARRVKLLANEDSSSVHFSLTQERLVLKAENPLWGDATEKISVNYQGPNLDVGFNIRYVIELISVFDDSEVTFEFNNERSPFIVKSLNFPHFFGIVMPVKI
ncbi:MAG: DNA polymerase III subunit beta [Oligoflexia bacterium]|nr:DNA polymerase III subunit beta [Oligoflexia bacterium]